jgi:parallel beta-helix repeat protein
MKLSRLLFATFSLVLVAILCSQQATATTLKVGSCQLNDDEHVLAQFATIQAAVNAAPTGSRVLVCPGTYAEQVEITKPLTLMGVASGNRGVAVIVPPPSGLIVPPGGVTTTAPQVFVHDTPGPVIVSNLTVDGSNSQIANCANPTYVEGVYFLDASGEIENILAQNQSVLAGGQYCGNGLGLRLTSFAGSAVVTLENNTVSHYDWGIFASYPQAKATIRNNSLLGNQGTAGIVLYNDVGAAITGNSVVGNSDATIFGSGIDVVGVNNAVISENHFAYNGYGITFYTFDGVPSSDGGTVTNNDVFGSDGDGIDICGDNNLVEGNTVAGSAQSGLNLVTGPNFGAQCTSNNNKLSDNTVNGACAGVLIDPAASGNIVRDDNRIFNAVNLHLTGITCLTPVAASKVKRAARIGQTPALSVRPGH